MEMMSVPSKEVLTFSRKINGWIVKDEQFADSVNFIFEKDTPQAILELFEKIKDKLPSERKLTYTIAK